jgi:hypothetical protein
MQPEQQDVEALDEDDILNKVPTRYRDLYDSDDFEKFTHKHKEWD